MSQIAVLIVATVTMALAASSCGIGGGRALDDVPLDVDKGRQLFKSSCRVCHTLADADASGVFGPDLDQLQPDAERVREQIDRGGGGMPDDILRDADADVVAKYVAEVAGRRPEDDQQRDRGAVTATG